MITWLAMKTFSQSSWLALSGVEQDTFRVASFWLGERRSGRLIHVAKTMDPAGRLLASSMSIRELVLSGSNSPQQGTI